MGVILYSGWYSTDLCKAHPEKLFVFGDNTIGIGKGGQAIIRDEPNAYGVPTKRLPSMASGAFFEEENDGDLIAVLNGLAGVWGFLRDGGTVVVPVTGQGKVSLGLERAELPQRAPSLYKTIETHVQEMCDGHGMEAHGSL